jgi:hypothetical protein
VQGKTQRLTHSWLARNRIDSRRSSKQRRNENGGRAERGPRSGEVVRLLLGTSYFFLPPLHLNPDRDSGNGCELNSPTVVADVMGSPITTSHAFGFG